MPFASTAAGTVALVFCVLLIAGGTALLLLARMFDDDAGDEIPPADLPLDFTGRRK